MGCGCQGGMFTPGNVVQQQAQQGAPVQDRMVALMGAPSVKRWNGPLEPVKQPTAK